MEQIRPQSRIMVMGVGGCGGNAVSYLGPDDLPEMVTTVALNTDVAALADCHAGECLALGPQTTRGYGAGSDPEVGRDACIESEEALQVLLQQADILFLVAGLGGGTGTGPVQSWRGWHVSISFRVLLLPHCRLSLRGRSAVNTLKPGWRR
ncbi:hypothetical protein GCM10023333_41910 [Ferrimonas pelagia]|uniref:Tubulin/FtsZ GTPase domain-containing protein n=1 Tax=Ferrimonas pelagia TaxID=1177826 RepID=A0ABP9FHF7_9GAMM